VGFAILFERVDRGAAIAIRLIFVRQHRHPALRFRRGLAAACLSASTRINTWA
jgi:hypothetical protein